MDLQIVLLILLPFHFGIILNTKMRGFFNFSFYFTLGAIVNMKECIYQ